MFIIGNVSLLCADAHVFVENFPIDDDRVNVSRFSKTKGKNQSLAVRGLTRYLLQQYLGTALDEIVIDRERSGRPVVHLPMAGQRVDVSFSHSHHHITVAMSTVGRVGVDIESTNKGRDFAKIFGLIYGQMTLFNPSCLHQDIAYRLWVCAESFFKVAGRYPNQDQLSDLINRSPNSLSNDPLYTYGCRDGVDFAQAFILKMASPTIAISTPALWPQPTKGEYGLEVFEWVAG